eukprot:s1810_g14.t1
MPLAHNRACSSVILGPVDATSAPDSSETSTDIHAAVLDPSIDNSDPLHLWHTALLACERFERHERDQPDAAASDVRLAQAMLQRLADTSNHRSFEQDTYHQQSTTSPQDKLYAILPHADEPLDSYHPSFWSFCFPVLFPFGEGIDGQPRLRYFSDHAWGSMLLRRRDRPSGTHWRKDLDFVAVLFSVLHRRRLLRAVRVRVQAPTFREALPHGTIPEALSANDVPAEMKSILRFLQTVQGQVPCTDAARRTMRHRLTSMTTYFGYPLLFVTLNPADVLHPFTWRHALDTLPVPLPAANLDQRFLDALRSAQLWHVVAQDPTAAVEAFHLHIETFLQQLVDVPATPAKLPSDGIASSTGRGIFGPLTAAFGSIEPQQRGSLHIHVLFFCYGFQEPSSLLQRFQDRLRMLEARLWKWIQSVVVTAVEAIPPILHAPSSFLSQLRPLPYSDSNMRLMHQSYGDHLLTSTNHWFAAGPCHHLRAADFMEVPFSLDVAAEKPFLPWCLDYLASLSDPPSESMSKFMLFDLRTSIVHSGLLHSCQPRTCYKGKLGRRGYCRLGFWHWLPIASNVWERCHGIELCPKPLLGQDPPHTDAFRTERHHLFFGRVNPFVLMACKCNHDVSTLLRFPANYATAPNAAQLIHKKHHFLHHQNPTATGIALVLASQRHCQIATRSS